MNAIKNFLKPTKVTWVSFVFVLMFFVVVPIYQDVVGASYYSASRSELVNSFVQVSAQIMEAPFSGIFYFYIFLLGDLILHDSCTVGMVDCMQSPEVTPFGVVLSIITFLILLWLIPCIISKIWYAVKNKRNNVGLVS